MTDKQIIIDDLIKQLNEKTVVIMLLRETLDRKEQECEELKNQVLTLDDETITVQITQQQFVEYNQLKAENENLKKIIDEAKNSNIDLKSFLVGEAIQNEYEQQLDQLKAENKELKQYKTLYEKTRNLWNKARMNNYELLDEIKDLKDSLKRTVCQSECYKHKEADKLKQALVEIKEIAEHHNANAYCNSKVDMRKILQKISECEVENA